MFSQFQVREYIMGSVKLPFRTPAANTINMPSHKCKCSIVARPQFAESQRVRDAEESSTVNRRTNWRIAAKAPFEGGFILRESGFHASIPDLIDDIARCPHR